MAKENNVMTAEEKKKAQQNDEKKILLTAEEFEKKQRLETKNRINKITRVFGVFAIILLVYAGIFDPLFELSFFGAIFDREAFDYGWEALYKGPGIGDHWAEGNKPILDDPFQFGPWIGQLGLTLAFIAIIIVGIYFLTYCIVDVVDLFKVIFKSSKDITRSLSTNVKSTMPEIDEKEKKKPRLFSKKEENALIKEDKPEKEKPQKRRKEEPPQELEGYTSEELDALLRGENINKEKDET